MSYIYNFDSRWLQPNSDPNSNCIISTVQTSLKSLETIKIANNIALLQFSSSFIMNLAPFLENNFTPGRMSISLAQSNSNSLPNVEIPLKMKLERKFRKNFEKHPGLIFICKNPDILSRDLEKYTIVLHDLSSGKTLCCDQLKFIDKGSLLTENPISKYKELQSAPPTSSNLDDIIQTPSYISDESGNVLEISIECKKNAIKAPGGNSSPPALLWGNHFTIHVPMPNQQPSFKHHFLVDIPKSRLKTYIKIQPFIEVTINNVPYKFKFDVLFDKKPSREPSQEEDVHSTTVSTTSDVQPLDLTPEMHSVAEVVSTELAQLHTSQLVHIPSYICDESLKNIIPVFVTCDKTAIKKVNDNSIPTLHPGNRFTILVPNENIEHEFYLDPAKIIPNQSMQSVPFTINGVNYEFLFEVSKDDHADSEVALTNKKRRNSLIMPSSESEQSYSMEDPSYLQVPSYICEKSTGNLVPILVECVNKDTIMMNEGNSQPILQPGNHFTIIMPAGNHSPIRHDFFLDPDKIIVNQSTQSVHFTINKVNYEFLFEVPKDAYLISENWEQFFETEEEVQDLPTNPHKPVSSFNIKFN